MSGWRKTVVSVLTGVMFGMRSFAPMLGFALGAWTNSLYVDLTGKFAVLFRSFDK